MIEDLLKQIRNSSSEEQDRIIEELEAQPDRAVDTARAILRSGFKRRWVSSVQLLRQIGYPHNKAALPELIVDQVGDINSSAWREAVQTVQEMPIEIVVPYLIKILFDRGQTISYWGAVAEGICTMLSQVKGAYALQCCPTLIYVLSREKLPDQFDRTTILDILAVVDTNTIVYALPVLIDLAKQEGRATYVGRQAHDLLDRFDRSMLTPYQSLFV